MESTGFKPWRAFGEESDTSSNAAVFGKHGGHHPVVRASVSERSFASTESKWSVLRPYGTETFDAHVARGIGGANSVRSSLTDNLLNELDEMMPPARPAIEASTEYDHVRQLSLYLDRLGLGLPPAGPVPDPRQLSLLYTLRAFLRIPQPRGVLSDLEDVPNAIVTRQSVYTLVKWSILLVCTMALAVGALVVPQVYGVDLPDFFVRGIVLMVIAVIAAIFWL